MIVNSSAHALLYTFANRPILAVYQVPEFNRIIWVEQVFVYFAFLEKKKAINNRSIGSFGLEDKHGYVISSKA